MNNNLKNFSTSLFLKLSVAMGYYGLNMTCWLGILKYGTTQKARVLGRQHVAIETVPSAKSTHWALRNISTFKH